MILLAPKIYFLCAFAPLRDAFFHKDPMLKSWFYNLCSFMRTIFFPQRKTGRMPKELTKIVFSIHPHT